MIAILVYGQDQLWFARVTKRRSGDSWVKVQPEDAPEMQSPRPEYAVLKAITAYERGKRRACKCERCGHEWHLRKGRDHAPKKCPSCRNAWRYKRRPTVVPEIGGKMTEPEMIPTKEGDDE